MSKTDKRVGHFTKSADGSIAYHPWVDPNLRFVGALFPFHYGDSMKETLNDEFRKGIGKPGCCLRCGKKLDPKRTVWLELDQRTNTYTNTDDVPEEKSQGGFEFGPDCAEKELNLTAMARKKAGIQFERKPLKTQGQYDSEK